MSVEYTPLLHADRSQNMSAAESLQFFECCLQISLQQTRSSKSSQDLRACRSSSYFTLYKSCRFHLSLTKV